MDAAFELPIQSPPDDQADRQTASSVRPQSQSHRPPRPLSSLPPDAQTDKSASLKQLAEKRGHKSRPGTVPQRAGKAGAGREAGYGRSVGTAAATNSGGSLREMRLRRPALARELDQQAGRIALRPKTRVSPKVAPKSLLPVTERKSQEENKLDRRAKKDASETDKWDIAPDGSSAGREGRQFTVANVGNNGRIYLRPTVRPAHLRFPQPNFVFPITPPSTAGLDMLLSEKEKRGTQQQKSQAQKQADEPSIIYGSDWTPDQASPAPLPIGRPHFAANNTSRSGALRPTTSGGPGARPGGGHRRAVSDSTVQETSIARESDPGGFKIIITQPADEQRAKTLEDLDPKNPKASPPFLEVAIPTWKLGTPRFTLLGTPVLRGSSYAPTEDIHSSRRSYFNLTVDPSFSVAEEEGPISPRRGLFERQQERAPGAPLRLDDQPPGPRATYHSNYAAVKPEMFDSLTFKPACDDRSIVRFSPSTMAITAATPPRLVAEITSPKFMDYDLVSDFFLTYRSFLESSDLLRMLIARLRWAVARDDETGMVVRVRTFVALRHWILNYFMDDFVVDYSLRVLFCNLLNSFVDELTQDPRERKVQLKILTELKKCWRRSCAQYWDGPEFDDSLGPEVPISQGGIAGHRNPALDPSYWEQVITGALPAEDDDDSNFLMHLQSPESMVGPEPGSSFGTDGARTGHIDSIILGNRPSTPEGQNRPSDISERRQASPVSITSLDFVSCSFPTKNMRLMQATMDHALAAHPVEAGMMYSSTGPVATTPRALVGKRVRPSDNVKTPTHGPQHKRNNSLTDSLREHASATEKLLHKNTELIMSLPFAGSLVRGAVFPPGQPYVEVLPPTTSSGSSRQTTVFQPFPLESEDSQKEKASAMSSQGMRKLLGSVRRALSTKGQTISPTQGNFINISPIGPRGATTNRLPGTAIVPQARPRLNGTRPPVRIDLLGAKIAEDFKIAVREDASLDAAAQQEQYGPFPASELNRTGEIGAGTSTYSDSLFLGIVPAEGDDPTRPMSDTAITTGSKSIVIVDDTIPIDFPVMTGALPAVNSSVEAFAETFISAGADPTPPTTPPGQPAGTPRRSSYILGQHVVRPSLSADPLPPFSPGVNASEAESVAGPSTMPRADTSILPSSDILNHESDNIILPRPSVDDAADNIASPKGKATNSFGVVRSPASRRPPPSWVRGHARHSSSRSYKSSRSHGRKRFASFTSGMAPPSAAIRSFDASTYSEVSVDDSSEAPIPQPLRVLRRRPGGDLRAVANVGELDHAPLRRSHSLGSLTTYTNSIRSSYVHSQAPESSGFVDVISVDYSVPRDKADTFSVGMITGKKPKRQLSLFSTHSSKPVMRPSFEAEAQKLAQIPDDVDDDGGVESALLKLEGKFKPKPRRLSLSEMPLPAAVTKADETISAPLSGLLAAPSNPSARLTAEEKLDHRHRHIVNSDLAPVNLSSITPNDQLPESAATREQRVESTYETIEARSSSIGTSPRTLAFSPPPAFRPAAVPRMVEDVHSFLSESGESYSSIPLLDRGLTDDGRSKAGTTNEWGNRSVFDDEDDDNGTKTPTPLGQPVAGTSHGGSRFSSYEMVKKTESIEKIPPGETVPQSPGQGTEVSFLDDESDNASDLSSEMSAEVVEDDADDIYTQGTHQVLARSNTVSSRLPAHPLGDPQLEPAARTTRTPQASFHEQHPGRLVEEPLGSHPPSPPITLVQALQMSPETANVPELHDHQLWEDKPLPPTPSPDATAGTTLKGKQQAQEAEVLDAVGMQSVFENAPKTVESDASRKFSVHLPFILAFESDVLAQQFTLIEKDALHEIDWKELIEMRWKNAENSNARSWVEFLRNTDARGVEVVIARFNIMVKWAISEVILTQDLEERARCMIKFIHIAAHCRKYRNYATMSQITIALTSNEVSRLTKTWALVPPSDERTLRDLEAIVSPTRNFYNLRAEMEAVRIDNADAGCIPFVGIYTHDLLFNAQRPSEIASSPTTAPLVNFERCRFAASIVKTLLRLVEASALYTFQPIEGITERCLWMSALSDDDIRKYSEALE